MPKPQHSRQLAVKGGVCKKSVSPITAATVSHCLAGGDWARAVSSLEALRRSGEEPKLGTIQRWVRMADLAGTEAQAAQLLAAIMRTIPSSAGPMPTALTHKQQTGRGRKGGRQQGKEAVRRQPLWRPPLSPAQLLWRSAQQTTLQQPTQPLRTQPNLADTGQHVEGSHSIATCAASRSDTCEAPAQTVSAQAPLLPVRQSFQGCFMRLQQDPTTLPAKRPPNWQEQQVWAVKEGTLQYGPAPQVVRVDVPFVPGAMVLTGVLSPAECQQLIAASEACGYSWDVDYTFQPSTQTAGAAQGDSVHADQSSTVEQPQQQPSAARQAAGGDRAAGVVWVAEECLLGPLFSRVKHLLPQTLCGEQLVGLNARLRFYRYEQNNVYRPHIDGAWPGSGIRDGQLVHDMHGDRWSRMTFLVYLNDTFEGGSTTFFTPAADDPAALDAWGVQPVAGNVLVFNHGDTAGSLLHEGSKVMSGAKYVIRTDVLYLKASADSTAPAQQHL